MPPNHSQIEAYPAHWKATLMGESFWKDAEEFNRPIHETIESEAAEDLPSKFPFNIGSVHDPHDASTSTTPVSSVDDAPSDEKKRSHRRRFSMSDALNFRTHITNRSNHTSNDAAEELRRARSQSRIETSKTRAGSLLRTTLTRMTLRKKDKMKERDKDEASDSESLALTLTPAHGSPPPSLTTVLPDDKGTPSNPLLEFRGGDTWDLIPSDRKILGLDVFWPLHTDNNSSNNYNSPIQDNEMLPVDDMLRLSRFRNLRVLKITGMMQSYQQYIWQAAWLNVNLEELEMGMALAPRFRKSANVKWPYMKGGWEMNGAHYDEPVYYGDESTGNGHLDPGLGAGEYLDKITMEKAKICALALGRTRNRLSIRTLILTGFVVDADPFLHWFDPQRLKTIHFKDNCVDAGFYLSRPMRHVKVLFPKAVREKEERAVVAGTVDLLRQLKMIRLDGGKKVGEMSVQGGEGAGQTQTRGAGHDGRVSGMESKEEDQADGKSKKWVML